MALNTNIGPERVQVFDVPLGTVQVAGAATSVTAFIIGTSFPSAVLNSVVRVTNLDEFVAAFGGPDDVLYDGYYAVKGYYDNAGTGAVALIVNVGSSPTAADFIGNAAAGTGLRALDAQDTVGLVCVPGLPLEMAYLVHPAVIDYAETVRAEFGATLTTTFSLVSIPKEISKAQSNASVVTGQLVSISGSGPWTLKLQSLSSALAEVASITAPSGGAANQADYVSVYNQAGDQYIFWLDIDGAGTAPSSAEYAALPLAQKIEVDILSSDTASQVASAIVAAISASFASADMTVGTPSGAVFTITQDAVGPATDAVAKAEDGTAGGGFSVAITQQGSFGALDLSAVTAGMVLRNAAQSFQATIVQVSDLLDEVVVGTNPTAAFVAGDDVFLEIPSAINYKDEVVNNPSRLAAWYYNPLLVLDEAAAASAGDLVLVDPVGHVAGVIARIDANVAIGGPSHAPAGIQYAGIAGIQGLGLSISERIDGGPLRLAFINRITSFPGAGNIIFGGYTAGGSAVTADEQLIQVIRSLQFIKSSLEPGLRGFLWENFSPVTQAQVASAILSFLRSNSYLFPAGLPETQQFRVISVTPTQDELDRGLLKVKVQVKPNKAVRFIEVELQYPIPTE